VNGPVSVIAGSPWEEPERIDRVGRLADAGDMKALAEVLLTPWFGSDFHEGTGVATRLRAVPRDERVRLAQLFVEHHNAAGSTPDRRERAMVLLALVADGFTCESWRAAWTALLESRAERWYSASMRDELAHLAEAVLAAGGTLSAEVVGLIRRSEQEGLESVGPLLDRLPEPVLNPGEPWADRILAELPGLGEPWQDLVLHLRTARTNTPTRRWDRTALALLEPLDAETVRRTVTPWLGLATHGGSGPEDAYDAYNIHAIRGLAWLLPLLPPHPDTARVLGALVERPPVKSVVAGAGVRGLARCGEAGGAELARLAGCVRHKVTLGQIHKALVRAHDGDDVDRSPGRPVVTGGCSP